MTLPLFTQSWISLLLYLLLILIVGIGTYQSARRHFMNKSDLLLHSLIPLGMASLSFSMIGLIKNYVMAFKVADAGGELTKIELAHAVVHGSLNGAPYVILGMLSLGISYIFRYINQENSRSN